MLLSTRWTRSEQYTGIGLVLAALVFAGCADSSPLAPAGLGDAPLLSAAAASPTINRTFNNLGGLAVTGTATQRCVNQGTAITIHLSGLQSKGVYTGWLLRFDEAGLIGAGALGAIDGSQNRFQVSESGEGQLSVIMPAGGLSLFGAAGDCLPDDESEYHLVVFFHTDGQTHGPSPFPGYEEGGFIFD